MGEKNVENSSSSLVINDAESVFDFMHLSYHSTEIESMIDRFESSMSSAAHQLIIDLLQATVAFRRSTVPEGVFQELRTKTKSDEELKQIFIDMDNALLKINLSEKTLDVQDKRLIAKAVNYCKKSINQRMDSLHSDDRLVPFWQHSELKTR